jgi:hypothetical protein
MLGHAPAIDDRDHDRMVVGPHRCHAHDLDVGVGGQPFVDLLFRRRVLVDHVDDLELGWRVLRTFDRAAELGACAHACKREQNCNERFADIHGDLLGLCR